MIDIVILCPIAVEYDAVRQNLERPSVQRTPQNKLAYEIGEFMVGRKVWNIAVFETDSHVRNVQLKTFQIIQELKPNYIFLVGVAGGIKDVQIGDLVVGTKAYCYEDGKVIDAGFESRPKVIDSSQFLIENAKQLNRELKMNDFKVVFGPINCGDKVITSKNSEQYRIIKSRYGDTRAIEMESIGFAYAASLFKNVAFINIRGISDLIDNKTKSDNSGSQERAAKRAADFTFRLIEKLPKPQSKDIGENVKVFYSPKPLSYWRNPKEVILTIFDTFICFKVDETLFKISEIEKLEQTKMKGDFAENWVKCVLIDGQEFYFSKKTVFWGIRNIWLKDESLLNKLEKFKINV